MDNLNEYEFKKKIVAENREKAWQTFSQIVSFHTDINTLKTLFDITETSTGTWQK